MFDHIDVDKALLPVREAANNDDLEAMFILLEKVVEGKHTKQCGENALNIINAILRHKTLDQEKPLIWKLFSLFAQARRLHYEQGKDSFQRAMRDACDYMESMIRMMTKKPRSEWDVELLEKAVTLIRTYQPLLSDTEILH